MSEEKYGFKIGQKVRLISGGGDYPLFGFSDGREYVVCGFDRNSDVSSCVTITDGSCSGYASSSQLSAVQNNFTTVTGPATITVAARETITFEGNATVKQDWVPKFGDRVMFVEPPEDMVGDFGVVTEIDDDDMPYTVAYNDGNGSEYVRCKPSEIKPYEAE